VRRGRLIAGGAVIAAGVVVAGVLTGSSQDVPGNDSPPPWPAAPYVHEPMNETSVAQPVATGGDVDRVAAALADAGFSCAQVRANDAARQIWCRQAVPRPDDHSTVDVTTVDLVTTPDGSLEYAGIDLREGSLAPSSGGRPYADRLRNVLDSLLLTLWPEDADDVQAAVADLGHPAQGRDPNDPRRPESRTATTEHATYRVTELADSGSPSVAQGYVGEDPELSLTLATPLIRDASWPYGSGHYATTTVAAAPGLEAGGFDCYGPIERPCTRPAGNQQIDYRTFDDTDRILSVSFGAGGGVLDPAVGPEPLSAWGFPQGLTFLGDEVRAAVEERVDAARLSGESFAGIVAGVVVVLDAGRTPTSSDGTYGVHVQATVGTPLVEVPLG
jgi:hypothetical protein